MAIIYQISLHGSAFDARDLSWDEAIAHSGCQPDRAWKDPIHNRALLKGEFGCSVSHLEVWRKIAATGLNGIILEEDAVFEEINPQNVDHKLESYDSAWLGYRWNDMGYWYNCHAYAITPVTAQYLIDGFAEAIIPVDEWVPMKLKERNNYFYEPERVKQIPRASRPSTIEGTEKMDIESMAAIAGVTPEKIKSFLTSKDVDFRIVTVATEESKMWALEQSAAKYGVTVHNVGKDHPWRDPMTGLAGMPKIQLINEYLATVPEDAVVLFMDGYDTFFADSPLEVLKRYYEMSADIVFGAERDCWPLSEYDQSMQGQWPDYGDVYRFLNSGLYIGKAKALHSFIATNPDHTADKDDQLYCQLRYLEWRKTNGQGKATYTVKLDREAYIFQNYEPKIKVVNGQLWNDETNCCGCIYHGNGGEDAKSHFVDMAEKFGFIPEAEVVEPQSPYYLTLKYEEVGPDILCTDFLTERQCDFLIQKSERHGDWGQLEGDKFPAQEIRLRQLGLWHEYERLWREKLGKIAEQHWTPMAHIGLRDAFTMKYTTKTQKSLGLHTDASLVTGSVKLNEDFEGAEVVFPRQNFSNINVPRGKCLLWPSEVTHGHYVPDLLSGTKYSLTMWTSRYQGDVNG